MAKTTTNHNHPDRSSEEQITIDLTPDEFLLLFSMLHEIHLQMILESDERMSPWLSHIFKPCPEKARESFKGLFERMSSINLQRAIASLEDFLCPGKQ